MPQSKTAFESDLLTTADAAQILSLSADMVRLLARGGSLPIAAESVSGVRLFRRGDVDALASERAGHRAHDHAVQFYDGIDHVNSAAAEFLAQGLASHSPALLFVTPERRRALVDRLAASGHPVREAESAGRLAVLDPRETLERFMVDGMPDPQRFRAHLVPLIEARSAGGRMRLRVYGEMVDMLCREGLHDAALRFEELWNDLARGRRLSRLCGYSMDSFRGADDVARFERLCELHTRVMPSERFLAGASDPQERLRRVALLEQRARALDGEIERRQRAERELRTVTRRGEPR